MGILDVLSVRSYRIHMCGSKVFNTPPPRCFVHALFSLYVGYLFAKCCWLCLRLFPAISPNIVTEDKRPNNLILFPMYSNESLK